jgi:uncharacterized damage-inducible protein DinB
MPITPEQATFLFHTILPSFENEHRITYKILKAVPAEKAEYRPSPNSMSAFDLAWHIAASETRFIRSIQAGEFYTAPFEKAHGMAEVLSFYAEHFKLGLEALKAMSGEQLAKVMDFRGIFQLPAVEFISFAMHHTIHHRGQLSVYLRPMGGKVPSMYGESYDDAQERLATVAAH